MKLTIGEIVKAQGIKGEVKVRPDTDDPSQFGRLRAVLVGGCPLKLRSASVRGGFVYLSFEGITDRNAAGMGRSQARQLDDGEYFIVDLVGCRLFLDSGEEIGKIVSIDNYGSADVFTVRGEKTVRFPFLKKLALSYDGEARSVTVSAAAFSEVCCYED